MRFYTFLFLLACLCPAQAQRSETEPGGMRLTGVVQDAVSGRPVPGATVRLLATQFATQADGAGRFGLVLPTRHVAPAGHYVVAVSSVGYQTAQQAVPEMTNGATLTVALAPAVVQLNQQLVTTTSRREEADFLRPELVTVLTTRDLRQRAPRTVPEALTGATGVWLQKTNHGGGSPFVRGLTGQQTLLLVDGIRLNNATFRSGPNQYLNTIDPQSVAQIDVVRSTGSVAYGSDAIGGVVNVLTYTPAFADKPTALGRVFGKAATGGMEWSGRAEAGYSSAGVAVMGGLAYRHFGDLVAGRGLGRLSPTGYTQWSGDVKARLRLGSRYVATLAYQDLTQDSVPVYHKVRLENFRYNQFDPQRRQLGYARLEGYYGRKLLQSVQLTASWQRQTEGRQSQKNNSPTAVLERDQTTSRGLTVQVQSAPTPYWSAQSGLEWYADYVRSNRRDQHVVNGNVVEKRGLYPDRATMHSVALFSLHTLSLRRLTLTGGARYNAFRLNVPGVATPTDAATTSSPATAQLSPSALVGNLGASWALVPGVRLVGSMATAFRAPNIDDLGTLGIVDFRYELPNASLRPERSRNLEAGVKIRTGRLAATLLGYHNRLTDFISRVRAGQDSIQGYPVYLKQNSAVAFIRGLEAEAEYAFWRNWLVYSSAVYTYGQNVTAGEPFRRIPPLNGRVGVTYQTANGPWARVEWLWAGAQRRLAKADAADNRIGPTGTAGWHLLNLSGGYHWRAVTLSAELHNLTNRAYRTHGSGVDGTGRSAWLAVLVNW